MKCVIVCRTFTLSVGVVFHMVTHLLWGRPLTTVRLLLEILWDLIKRDFSTTLTTAIFFPTGRGHFWLPGRGCSCNLSFRPVSLLQLKGLWPYQNLTVYNLSISDLVSLKLNQLVHFSYYSISFRFNQYCDDSFTPIIMSFICEWFSPLFC